jgi:hypothetical protein
MNIGLEQIEKILINQETVEILEELKDKLSDILLDSYSDVGEAENLRNAIEDFLNCENIKVV